MSQTGPSLLPGAMVVLSEGRPLYTFVGIASDTQVPDSPAGPFKMFWDHLGSLMLVCGTYVDWPRWILVSTVDGTFWARTEDIDAVVGA